MSRESLLALASYSKSKDVPLMVIASRNQVDCADVGGGYVYDTETFARFVRSLNAPKLYLCRDHSGPFLHKSEDGLSLNSAVERTIISLKADIDAGFDLLHIDASACGEHERPVAERLFGAALDHLNGRPMEFEYGSEENVGIAATEKNFLADVEFGIQMAPLRFVVGQTGSLVKSVRQAGVFDAARSSRLVDIANRHDVGLKEHNADYLHQHEIALRWKVGVAAMNIAPELGVRQTDCVWRLAIRYGLDAEWERFSAAVLKSNTWVKWAGENDHYRVISAGHYLYGSSEYRDLVGGLSLLCDVDTEIINVLTDVIARYGSTL